MNAVAAIRACVERRNWAVALAAPLLVAAIWMPDFMFQRNVFSYLVTFDITQSMDTEDVGTGATPVSRLAFAREAMRESLARLPCGSKIGWSVFAGQNTLLLVPPIELCANFDALLASLDSIGGDMRWTNWSRVAEGGVYAAVRTATNVGQDAAVLFVTDGQEAPPVLPADQRVRDIPRGQVKGWLIGVGGDQPVPIPRTDRNGKRIGYWRADDVIQVPPQSRAKGVSESHEELSSLRAQYLEAVAQQVGFGYRRLRVSHDLADAMMNEQYAHRERVPTRLNWIPAALAFALLLWRFVPWIDRRV